MELRQLLDLALVHALKELSEGLFEYEVRVRVLLILDPLLANDVPDPLG